MTAPRTTYYKLGNGTNSESKRVEFSIVPKNTNPVLSQAEQQEQMQRHAENEKNAAGRRAWSLLHRYRGCDPQWVELWEYFIPSGGCSCKAGYKEILKDHPFDYSSPDAFFASGVALHNAVNRKLNKPELTLEDARKLWIENIQGGDNASTENASP
jgi:hypothetical protein